MHKAGRVPAILHKHAVETLHGHFLDRNRTLVRVPPRFFSFLVAMFGLSQLAKSSFDWLASFLTAR